MRELERLLDFRKRLEQEKIYLQKAQRELSELQAELPLLEQQAIEAEALQAEGWQKLKAQLEQKQRRLGELPGEISKIKRKIEILEKELPKYEEAVLKEIKKYYFNELKPLVSAWVKEMKKVYEVERKIFEIKEEAERKKVLVTHFPRIVTPYIPFLLYELDPTSGVRCDGPTPVPAHRKFKTILKTLREEGFDVDLELSE